MVIYMITLAICDDEAGMAEILADLLSEYFSGNEVDFRIKTFADGNSLLESSSEFDLIFLDIRMPPPDGMETARLLRERGNRSLLIFTTVLTETVFDAFSVRAFDYLVKPLDEKRFRQTMDRVLGELSKEARTRLILRQKGMYAVVPLSDLVYCEVQGRKLYLHRTDGTVLDFYGRLDEFTKRVDTRFFRCHRSYLVNLDHIRGCSPGRVYLIPNGEIPVSRLREQALKQALLCHMKRPAGTQTPPIPAD